MSFDWLRVLIETRSIGSLVWSIADSWSPRFRHAVLLRSELLRVVYTFHWVLRLILVPGPRVRYNMVSAQSTSIKSTQLKRSILFPISRTPLVLVTLPENHSHHCWTHPTVIIINYWKKDRCDRLKCFRNHSDLDSDSQVGYSRNHPDLDSDSQVFTEPSWLGFRLSGTYRTILTWILYSRNLSHLMFRRTPPQTPLRTPLISVYLGFPVVIR